MSVALSRSEYCRPQYVAIEGTGSGWCEMGAVTIDAAGQAARVSE